MDAMPQGARNQVLAQLRRNEGVEPPEKHHLRKQQPSLQVTEKDLEQLRQYMYEVHGIDLLRTHPEPLSEAEWAALVEPVPVPEPEPNGQQARASEATRPSLFVLIAIALSVASIVADPAVGLVVSLTLLMVGVVRATIGRTRI